MANRERIIEGMKRCLGVFETGKEDCCVDCVYRDSPRYCQDDLLREAVELLEGKTKQFISWQYCNDPNKINEAIKKEDENWEGLRSAEQIISISWNPNQGCYEVFWRE